MEANSTENSLCLNIEMAPSSPMDETPTIRDTILDAQKNVLQVKVDRSNPVASCDQKYSLQFLIF